MLLGRRNVKVIFVSAGKALNRILFEAHNKFHQDRQSELFNYLEEEKINVTTALIDNLVTCACSMLPGGHRITR